MRVISTQNVNIISDREGILSGRIAIDIWVDRKDDLGKEYHIWTKDVLIIDYGLETQFEQAIYNRNGSAQRKEYIKSYDEYDTEKVALENAYPTDLEGSEKDDYLLQSGLLYNLIIDPIYGLDGNQWARY